MNKIYEQLKDLHVRNYVVFGKAADNKIYYDAAYETQVTEADLKDAFLKGALLIDNAGEKLVPVSLNANVVKTIGEGEDEDASLVSWTAAVVVAE